MSDRRLILMRHARQAGIAVRDHERPLTQEGQEDAWQVGQRLAREALVPALVVSSTALRCRETWQAVAAGLASPTPILAEHRNDLYNGSPNDLTNAIAEVSEDVDTLLVIAHNPGISLLAIELAESSALDAAAVGAGGPDAKGPDPREVQGGFTPATTAAFEVSGPWSTLSRRNARLIAFDRA